MFARLYCASNYDGNLHDVLCVPLMPGKVECDLVETPALIGLHGAKYMVVFRPDECFVHVFAF